MFYLNILQELNLAKIKYAVAGGFAVALHGAVRGTVDLDLVLALNLNNIKQTERVLNKLGLQSRIPVDAIELFKFRKEYIEKRNLIAWSFQNYKNPAEVVDIIITHDLTKMRTKTVNVSGTKIFIVSLKDLIAMKSAAGRPQDIEDIKALRSLNEKS